MATVKRLNDSYTIDTADVYITGNLRVTGVYDTVNVTDTRILDKNLYLNSGETGAGVGGDGFSGLIVERGSSANVVLRWNESIDKWQLTTDGTSYANIVATTSATGNTALVDDPNPTLSANLNTNQQTIFSNIANVEFAGNIQVNYTTATPTAVPNTVILYTGVPNAGQTGLYVVNGNVANQELITKTRSIGFSLLL